MSMYVLYSSKRNPTGGTEKITPYTTNVDGDSREPTCDQEFTLEKARKEFLLFCAPCLFV